MKVDVLTVGTFQVNCIILGDEQSGKGIVIDPGEDAPRILARIDELGLDIEKILLTHGHLDHVLAVGEVKEATGAQAFIHPDDKPLYEQMPAQGRMFGFNVEAGPPLDGDLAEGQIIEVGAIRLKVIHTPGHSPGGVSFLWEEEEKGIVFCGDTMFARSIGRTDLPGGDYNTLIKTIKQRLLTLDPTYRAIPGHMTETTIGAEAQYNPFLTGASWL